MILIFYHKTDKYLFLQETKKSGRHLLRSHCVSCDVNQIVLLSPTTTPEAAQTEITYPRWQALPAIVFHYIYFYPRDDKLQTNGQQRSSPCLSACHLPGVQTQHISSIIFVNTRSGLPTQQIIKFRKNWGIMLLKVIQTRLCPQVLN